LGHQALTLAAFSNDRTQHAGYMNLENAFSVNRRASVLVPHGKEIHHRRDRLVDDISLAGSQRG
jgi:hypothetical protein